jgi:hypothetical protein
MSANETVVGFAGEVVNSTMSVLAGVLVEEGQRRVKSLGLPPATAISRKLPDTVGIGTGWLKSLLGRNEWTLPCVNVKIRL